MTQNVPSAKATQNVSLLTVNQSRKTLILQQYILNYRVLDNSRADDYWNLTTRN